MAIRVIGLPTTDMPALWDRIAPFAQSTADRSHGRWPLNTIRREAMQGQTQVWIITTDHGDHGGEWKAVALTSIEKEAVMILAAVGKDRELWQDELLAKIEQWAEALGRKYVIATARPGWSPLLRSKGYRETHREMTKSLDVNDG